MGLDEGRLQDDIAALVEQFEFEQMGIQPTRVNVMVRGDVVIVHLKEILPAAEKHLALTERGQDLVSRFATMLFREGAHPSLEQLISSAMGKPVLDVQTAISPLTGSIVAMFELGGPTGG
jgi:uncharacterized protein YbcI